MTIATHVIDISDGSLKTAQDLLDSHFKGLHVSTAALDTAYPTGSSGDYANVDPGGTGTVTARYIWDVDDAAWILGSSGGLDHTHSNKAVLDATTASFTTADETTVDKFTLSTNLIAIDDGFRPGLFTGAAAASGSVFESSVDGHLWWKHRDDSLHLLCDTSPYGSATVWGTITGTLTDQSDLVAALNLKADSLSPTFTGIPLAPTASLGTNTTQIATTAFVATGLALKANLASPVLTGVPTAPTATPGTATYQLATTEFVDNAVGGSHTHTLTDITDSGNLAALNSVGTVQIDADAVTADKLADTTVAAGAYTNADITVDAQGRVTSAASGSSSGTTWGTITGTLSAQTDLGNLAALDTVGTVEIAANAVTTAKVLDANITAAKLAATAVTAGNYTNADLTVDAQGRLTACSNGSSSGTTWGTITGTLSNQTDLGALAALDTVGTAEIAAFSVTTAKIAALAVGTSELAADCVTAAKIAAFAVTAAELDSDCVTTTKILDDNVTAAKLADTAVTPGAYTNANLTVDAQGRITTCATGSASGGSDIDGGTAAAPGLPVVGDGDTGVYSDTADTLGISAGGVEAIRAVETAGAIVVHIMAGEITCADGVANAEKFGAGSNASGGGSLAVGNGASANNTDSVAVGKSSLASSFECQAFGSHSTANGNRAVAVGHYATASNDYCITVGTFGSVSGNYGTGVGGYIVNTHDYAICLGYKSVSEDDNAMNLGARLVNAGNVSRIYFGHGCTSAYAGVTPSRIWATSGAGTNIPGTDLELAGGSPTGSGAGGEVKILTAEAGATGTTLRTLYDRITVAQNGDIDCHDNIITFGDATLTGDLIVSSPTVPVSASATGTAGMISWDASYIYICTAANTWKRVAIATW